MDDLSWHDLSATDAIPAALLTRTETDLQAFTAKVKPIIEAVRTEGDAALLRFAREFDGVRAAQFELRVQPQEFDAAFALVSREVVTALEHAIDNIRRFHEAQKPEDLWFKEIEPGVWVGDRHVPIDSVACYVPRGKGSFPSVVNMTTLPGVVAGVPRLIIVTPPGADGTVDAGTLVAAKLIGVTEVYRCGGAQAVAAVAYGTETVPRCLKIVGPGSPWVVAAKRLLADAIDPGVPAGPSESLILADAAANPEIAALDACFSHIPEGVRSVLIHGIGANFSAGLDLSEISERNVHEGVLPPIPLSTNTTASPATVPLVQGVKQQQQQNAQRNPDDLQTCVSCFHKVLFPGGWR